MTRFLLPTLLVTAFLLTSSAVASAQITQWTAVGSTGSVDDADMAMFDTAQEIIQIKTSAALPAVLNVRYNVVAVAGVFTPADGVILTARFRDNGPDARVVAVLKQVAFDTGVVTTLLTLDSNLLTAMSGFQTQSVGNCSGNPFNFLENAYFVDVTIRKSGTAGTPALQLLQVSGNLC